MLHIFLRNRNDNNIYDNKWIDDHTVDYISTYKLVADYCAAAMQHREPVRIHRKQFRQMPGMITSECYVKAIIKRSNDYKVEFGDSRTLNILTNSSPGRGYYHADPLPEKSGEGGTLPRVGTASGNQSNPSPSWGGEDTAIPPIDFDSSLIPTASPDNLAATGETPTQREVMLALVERHGFDQDTICREYAACEERGEVQRNRNGHSLSALEYATALYRDMVRKGWADHLR